MEATYRLWPFWAMSVDMKKLTNALLLATKYHEGTFRKYNGEPYIVHPIRVAMAVSSYPLIKLEDVQAALLHDTKEDTGITDEEIVNATSETVLKIVNELTNQTKGLKLPRRDRKKLDWQRLAKVSFKAKLIKMFDRIDNLRDMVNAPTNFKHLYIEESRELLTVVGDADKDIAWQLDCACKAMFDWRPFTVGEMLGKPDGTEVESARHGLGVVWTKVTEDGKYKTVSFDSDKHYQVNQTTDNDWYLLRETGKCRT